MVVSLSLSLWLWLLGYVAHHIINSDDRQSPAGSSLSLQRICLVHALDSSAMRKSGRGSVFLAQLGPPASSPLLPH